MPDTPTMDQKVIERYLFWTINFVQRIEQGTKVKEYSITAKIKEGKPYLVITCSHGDLSYFKLLVKGWLPLGSHEDTQDDVAELYIPVPGF